MEINLSDVELATLSSLCSEPETLEDALHKILLPFVKDYTETSLQRIANIYRSLSPELQATAFQAVLKWKALQDSLTPPDKL